MKYKTKLQQTIKYLISELYTLEWERTTDYGLSYEKSENLR